MGNLNLRFLHYRIQSHISFWRLLLYKISVEFKQKSIEQTKFWDFFTFWGNLAYCAPVPVQLAYFVKKTQGRKENQLFLANYSWIEIHIDSLWSNFHFIPVKHFNQYIQVLPSLILIRSEPSLDLAFNLHIVIKDYMYSKTIFALKRIYCLSVIFSFLLLFYFLFCIASLMVDIAKLLWIPK